ncbi:hypothetical protein SAY87_009245 [Trapa incisa]|uniref:Calcium-transporting ATPase n=1 Tax=Trapa incisa TaxID=236973 RepID=A0AAN7JVD3_9MYRT|nr:hypothetical protein SAY87_009245 [Trapa incisa]
MAMSLRHRNPGEIVEDPVAEPACLVSSIPRLSHQRRRLRQACTAIYFTKVLESLTKKVIGRNLGLIKSLSYIAIDVSPQVGDGCKEMIDHKSLSCMVREKSHEALEHLGGVVGLASVLKTDLEAGLDGDDEADLVRRKNTFGENRYTKPPAKHFFSFVLEAFKDMTILILLGCAVLSLVFGIKQHRLKDGWYDGGSIILAIFLVVAVSAISNYKQSRQFQKLSSVSSDIRVEVVRGGRRQKVSIFEILVGDIVCLKIGDQIPADGLFIDGHSLKVDESSMTGESDHLDVNGGENPFMLSGTKVTDGYGRMLVTSVGMSTGWGEMMSSVARDLNEETPLQARLNKLTSSIGKIGLTVALVVLVVMMIRYFMGKTLDESGRVEFQSGQTKSSDVINAVLRIVAAAVTIVVVAIPEGLPLAVTLTLAYSMKKMMSDNAMVRKLSACETMGSVTTICTDKTGTLTLNEMKVTEFWIGKEQVQDGVIAHNVLEQLLVGVGLNTTGTVYMPGSPTSVPEVSGSPTEKAILSWGVIELGLRMDELRQDCKVIQVEAFNSEKKRSGVSLKKGAGPRIHVHWKGAAEMILAQCSEFYSSDGYKRTLDAHARADVREIIERMAAKSLRCIAFAYREFADQQAHDSCLQDSDLTLLGIAGLKDPCRPEVRSAVESSKAAGVNIMMITGDNVHTARAIAIESGILDSEEEDTSNIEEAIVEGVEFRNFSPEERIVAVDKIRVMARSSPFDKLLMVQTLKQKGHVVAVTGDGTNDAPALKEADIGLSMGIQGTEVAKESSDIVILDDNFSSVVTVIRWGRCVYNNIQKFIQFQLTVNVAALVINFVAAVSSGQVPLTAVQLLWVNLIMDTLGALALATEQPTNALMGHPPVGRTDPLITLVMWRNLIAQSLYQVTILLVLQFKGRAIFGVEENVKNTIIFNCFVFCQVFNEFNARKLEEKNVFVGLHKNKLFLGIIGITIVLQIVMIEFLKRFANTVRLDWAQWAACIGIASLTWPLGWLIKCIPVSLLQSLLPRKRASSA